MKYSVTRGIKSLHLLGEFLREFLYDVGNLGLNAVSFHDDFRGQLGKAMIQAEVENPWFTKEFQLKNLESWARILNIKSLEDWLSAYPSKSLFTIPPKRIGLILAGNIPLVGFHDIISVLLSGHIAVAKMSSKDKVVYPVLRNIMANSDSTIADRWILTEGNPLKNLDAVIATGSDNSSRYFDYYFGKYPNIIRKNRNSIAILTGNETDSQMKCLADDIFLYFGLGCRNVSKLYVPENFNPDTLYRNSMEYSFISNHNKYANNYDYYKAVMLLNKVNFLDNGFLLLKEDASFTSPVGCLHFEKYTCLENLYSQIELQRNKIQCMVTVDNKLAGRIEPGMTQFPELSDYSDGIDTLNFLFNLYEN